MKRKIRKTYRFFTSDNTVIAVSTYAGKTVRGVARCSDKDTFSIEDGKALAAARCNEKIALKRWQRASKKMDEAILAMRAAQKQYADMYEYLSNSGRELSEARRELDQIMKKLAS